MIALTASVHAHPITSHNTKYTTSVCRILSYIYTQINSYLPSEQGWADLSLAVLHTAYTAELLKYYLNRWRLFLYSTSNGWSFVVFKYYANNCYANNCHYLQVVNRCWNSVWKFPDFMSSCTKNTSTLILSNVIVPAINRFLGQINLNSYG